MITETWRWRFVAMWIMIFTVAVAYSLVQTHNLANSNKQTIARVGALSHENKDALCHFQVDLVQRTVAIEQLVRRGEISSQDKMILKELERSQVAATQSLKSLNCER